MSDEAKETTQREKSKARKVWEIFLAYIKAMAFAFTGGYMALPLLQQQLGDRYKLMSRDKVLENYVLGQVIPGVISLNSGILIGRQIAGWAGALAAVAGCVLPAFFGMLVLALSYSFVAGIPAITGAIGGIRAASIAIILTNAVGILKDAKTAFYACIAIAAFVTTFFFGWNIVLVIILCGLCGVARVWWQGRREPDATAPSPDGGEAAPAAGEGAP